MHGTPVYKQILFIWKREGLSKEQFREYYDGNHMAVLSSILSPAPRAHERSYPVVESELTPARHPNSAFESFDAMTAVAFDRASDRESWLTTLSDPSPRKAIEADEARFIDAERRMMFVVDERGRAEGVVGDGSNAGDVHLVRLLRRRSEALSREEFRTQYEREIARYGHRLQPASIAYRRNYLLPRHPWSYAGKHAGTGAPPSDWIDLVEELSFVGPAAALDAVNRLRAEADRFPSVDASRTVTFQVHRSTALPPIWRRQ